MLIGETKIDFKVSKFSYSYIQGDVALNWATHSFMSGPSSFYDLIKIAGIQPIEAINTFKLNIIKGGFKSGDVLSTIAGLLKFNLILHCIMPNNNDYHLTWRNIIASLKEYRKNGNICRNLYITIPKWEYAKDFIVCFLSYKDLIKDLEYVFIVKNEEERKKIESIFKSIAKKEIKKESVLLKKIDMFLEKIVLKISSMFPSTVISVNGNNKKKF